MIKLSLLAVSSVFALGFCLSPIALADDGIEDDNRTTDDLNASQKMALVQDAKKAPIGTLAVPDLVAELGVNAEANIDEFAEVSGSDEATLDRSAQVVAASFNSLQDVSGHASVGTNRSKLATHTEKQDDWIDFLHPSSIHTAQFEELPEGDEKAFSRLEAKKALVRNRFNNGAKNWKELGEEFEVTSKAEREFTIPATYQEEISAIGTKPRSKNVEPIVWEGNSVFKPLGLGDGVYTLTLEEALSQAANYAAQIAVFRELPAIRETSVQEARGRFKPEVFAEARYEDRDIPTTSLAQTAGDDRLREDDFATEFGVRKRVRTGAEVTLSQRFSSLETNLIEFDPNQQSRSRTVLSVRQPLLRDSGLSFNRALDNIAKLETDVAVQEFRRQSESHLLEVTRAYWTLYLARVGVSQQQAAVDRLSAIAKRVSGRRNIDAQALQLTRARAAEAEMKSALVRARNAVRNAEARLRALVNSPEIMRAQTMEIIPTDLPVTLWQDHMFDSIVDEAVDQRPEVKQAYLQHKASVLRKGVAANEALPQLDVIAEGSFNGREDDFNFGGAFDDANEGDYLVGLRFSMPIGRDERKARHKRRRLEELQQRRQVETTLTTIQLEAEISLNEYAVAFEEFQQRKLAVDLASKDLSTIEERWRRGVGGNGLVFLDMLIDANARLLDAQRQFVESLVTFKYAEANLDRARGRFLQERGFRIARGVDQNGTSAYTLEQVR
ncbi:MAG: TolC family protein [Pseudomonadota bacterium]